MSRCDLCFFFYCSLSLCFSLSLGNVLIEQTKASDLSSLRVEDVGRVETDFLCHTNITPLLSFFFHPSFLSSTPIIPLSPKPKLLQEGKCMCVWFSNICWLGAHGLERRHCCVLLRQEVWPLKQEVPSGRVEPWTWPAVTGIVMTMTSKEQNTGRLVEGESEGEGKEVK